MGFFSFGKRKAKRSTKGRGRKPPAAILKKCKKLRIKVLIKKGKKRVYRKISLLKKLIKRKMKSKKTHRKSRKSHRKTRKVVRRRFGFGSAPFSNNVANYGYNQPVVQNLGNLPQTNQYVTAASNDLRPPELTLSQKDVPTMGVYRPFFGEQVPTQVGPRDLMFMGQPDGTSFPVGVPFARFTTPFGRRRKTRRSRFGNNVVVKHSPSNDEINKMYMETGKAVRDFAKKCQDAKHKPSMTCVSDSLNFGRRKTRRSRY